jgi:hypothetical protein
VDRGARLTWTLLGAGLLLLGIVVAVVLLRQPGKAPRTQTAATRTAAPPATTAAPATTTAPAPPPGPLRIAELSPFSVAVAWHTTSPTTGRLALAVGSGPPTLWSGAVGPARDHTATIGGLAFDTDYRVEAAGHSVSFHTPLVPPSTVASTGDGAVLLGGQPFFPVMVWGECPAQYGALLAAGINLLANNPCGGTNAQVDALAGHALSAGLAGDAESQNPALIGSFYPDEADGKRITATQLPSLPASAETGRISFLTLTNHFYSKAAPLAWGRGLYRGLIAKADVVGFDLYPLQLWCHTELDDVYAAQAELVALAHGKPTFQWIETGAMGCRQPGTAVTPATVRAETWLAVAGGAHGLGYFPGEWTPTVGTAVAQATADVKSIAPALLAPTTAATANSPLRVAAHTLNGALYVVAANPTRRSLDASITVPAAGDRVLNVLGGGTVKARGGVIADAFGPFGAKVYVAPPA